MLNFKFLVGIFATQNKLQGFFHQATNSTDNGALPHRYFIHRLEIFELGFADSVPGSGQGRIYILKGLL